MPFQGDLSKLGKLGANLRKLSSVPARVAQSASERIAELIDEEFAGESDPYMRGWEPLALSTVTRKGGDDEILHRSGELRNTVDVHPMAGSGIAIELQDYAGFHQGGTKWMPKRPILPGNTMPRAWTDAISGACTEAFEVEP